MANAGLDEGVEKLQQFCGLLIETTARLLADGGTLDNLAGALEKFEETTEEVLGGLGERLADAAGSLEDAHLNAEEGIRGLAVSARELADGRLPAAEHDLQEWEAQLDDEALRHRAEVAQGSSELDQAGFDPLTAAIESAEEDAGRADQECAKVFDSLEQGIVSAREGTGDACEQTRQQVDTSAGTLTSAEADLRQEAGEAAEGWSSALPAALESQATDLGDPIQGAYEEFQSGVLAAADALVQEVARVFEAEAEILARDVGAELDTAARTVDEDALAGMEAAFALAVSALESCNATGDVLGEIVDGLAVARAVVGEIDRLLNALEQ